MMQYGFRGIYFEEFSKRAFQFRGTFILENPQLVTFSGSGVLPAIIAAGVFTVSITPIDHIDYVYSSRTVEYTFKSRSIDYTIKGRQITKEFN